MRIVDLSCDVAGRFAAKLLAMGGLEVLRPKQIASDGEDQPTGYLATYLDYGKKLIHYNEENLEDLLAGADLIFSSFDCGQYLGLGQALAEAVPPDCIKVTTSTFGKFGPYSKLRGGDLAAWSACGYLAITGDPDREPVIGPERLCGYIAGYTAAIAAEAALAKWQLTGECCDVDISSMESMLGLHQSTFSRLASGSVRTRTGRYAEVYPLVIRPCADGYISLGIATDKEFDRLCIVAGCHELLADERFSDGYSRLAHAEELDAALDAFLLSHTADKISEMLQANDVPAVKAPDPVEIFRNPQLEYRNYWVTPKGYQGARMPGCPIPDAKIFAEPGAKRKTSCDEELWPIARHRDEMLPLAGLRVLDFTAWWAGPLATRGLADLGADVLWVERPNTRLGADELVSGPGRVMLGLYEWKWYRHKRSITLDLETADALAIVRRLANEADVVVENFRPGVADRLGIGPETLCVSNPQLVYVSLSGFGSDGPWNKWRSYGPNIEAASSVTARTGYADSGPLRLGHALPDASAGLAGTLAALRGLRERRQRGCGGWYDISQLEVYTAMSGEELLEASACGTWSGRIGNRSRHGAIQGVFSCKGEDQWVVIRVSDANDLERFADLTGLYSLIDVAASVPRDHAAIEAIINSFTVSRHKEEVASMLQNAGLESLPVLTPPKLVEDTHLCERGFFVKVNVQGKSYAMPGHPFVADKRIADCMGDPPLIGEDNKLISTN